MNVTINSFTRTLPSIANEIITECGVSLPHRPGMGEHPTVLHTKGLWDTGATGCVITKRLATQLGLTPIGKTQTHHAGGTSTVNVYLVNIILTNNVGFPFIKVTECEETVGRFDIIIGMDLITRGDFAISNSGGQTTVSFRTPSVQPIKLEEDCLPKNMHKTDVNGTPIIDPKTSRNAFCPCKSGKRYKNCHGKAK